MIDWVVQLKGQIALDKDGEVVAKGDMREQTRKTLDNIRALTTTVQVVRLFHPDLVVETTATAEIPNDRFRPAGGS